MLRLRQADQRGHEDQGWLDSRHTFSFADYHDPEHMGFGPLRVINEDRVQPGKGFGTHSHRDMEIVSYVLAGELRHEDSIGHASTLRPGCVQRMTAGTGVRHSEMNGSDSEPLHFLQIWILPESQGLEPGYEEKTISSDAAQGRLQLIGSRDGRDGSLTIHQDVELYAARLADDDALRHRLAPGRRAWVQVVRGTVRVNGEHLDAGDGAAIEDEDHVAIHGLADAEVLLFDLPP